MGATATAGAALTAGVEAGGVDVEAEPPLGCPVAAVVGAGVEGGCELEAEGGEDAASAEPPPGCPVETVTPLDPINGRFPLAL